MPLLEARTCVDPASVRKATQKLAACGVDVVHLPHREKRADYAAFANDLQFAVN